MVLIPFSDSERSLIPVGVYPAVCKYEGLSLRRDFNNPDKKRADLRLVFQLGDRAEGSDRCYEKHIWFNRTLADKSNLRKFLAAWRGMDFNAAQLASFKTKPFDAARLVGQAALVNVVHETWKNGQVGDAIGSIMPLPKTYPNPPFVVEWYVGQKERWDQDTADALAYLQAQSGPGHEVPPPPKDEDDTTDYTPSEQSDFGGQF